MGPADSVFIVMKNPIFARFPTTLGVFLAGMALPAAGATLYWDGISGNWSNAANWSTDPDAATPNPLAAPGAADDVVFNITGANAAQDVSLNSANREANSVSILSTASTFFRRSSTDGTGTNSLLVGGGGLTLAAGAGPVTVGTDNQRINFRAQTSLDITNDSSSLLTFGRGVQSGATSGTTAITLNGSGSGGTAFVGAITDGGFGSALALVVDTTGGFTYLSAGSANTYSGGTTLSQGVLALRSSNPFGSGPMTIQGGTFGSTGGTTRSFGNAVTIQGDFQLGGVSIPSLANSATILDGDVDLDGGTRTITLGNSATFNGAISNGGLTIEAPGNHTLTLAGNSTYSGATLVSSGTLLLSGALGSTDLTIGAGATLRGSGSLGGDLAFSPGAFLDLTGSTLGETSIGILTVGGGSTITLTDFGFASILGWDAGDAAAGIYTLIQGAQAVVFAGSTPTEANPFDFGNGKLGYFQQGSLQAVIIPEPGTALLGGISLLALLRRRRR
jgi:autotransporter-associated beta strand protein